MSLTHTDTPLLQEKLELLKLEISVISDHISATVDSLWKIRSFSLTLWSATLGIGLGGLNNQPILALIVLTNLFPLWFLWIDAKYNRWYRRLTLRERQIQKFVNSSSYRLPRSGQIMTFRDIHDQGIFSFPIYDLSGEATFGKHPHFLWETSLIRNMIEGITIFIYGTQIMCSSVLSTLYISNSSRWIFIPIALIMGLLLLLYAQLVQRQLYRVYQKSK